MARLCAATALFLIVALSAQQGDGSSSRSIEC